MESEGAAIPEALARKTGELLGSQLASIASVIDPQAIVLAGGMLHPDSAVWLHAISTFRKTALPELVESIRVLPAQLGPFAAAIGAANQCLYEMFPVSAGKA